MSYRLVGPECCVPGCIRPVYEADRCYGHFALERAVGREVESMSLRECEAILRATEECA